MMPRITIYLFLFSVLMFGCTKKVTIDHEFESDKLILQGTISIDQGVEVYITKSFSPLETVNLDETSIINATITLYENEVIIGQLVYNADDDRYYYPNIENLTTEKYYSLNITVPTYPTLISEPVLLIGSPQVEVSSLVRTNSNDTTARIRIAELTLSLNDPEEENNLYVIDWEVGSEEIYEKLQILIKDGVILSCPASLQNNLLDNCFNGMTNVPIQLTSSYRDSISFFVNNILENEIVVATDSTKVTFRNIDELGQRFLQLQSVEFLSEFQTEIPSITSSNMSNGFGVFYAVGTKEFILASP